ncbi:MAG: oligopeptide transport system substrate-binding protein [Candidatus Binatia bacterium]|jgi:oligopeptide transport system substrate-binding protein
MKFNETLRALLGALSVAAVFVFCLWALSGFGHRESRVEDATKRGILLLSNGTEPEDLDPHLVTGIPEHNIITSLIEGLVSEDLEDLHPVPGVAERWDISEDGTVYTFHLRSNALWSNGEPVTAQDFHNSFKRMLTPAMASEYSYMLYSMKNAEPFNLGKIDDFSQVGARVIDERTLEITLESPTPYFLSLLNHYTWFPVHLPTVAKYGPVTQRGNKWTRPENFVGNGPFVLKEWRLNDVVIVEKSSTYWDAKNVGLNGIHFHAIDKEDTEERSFRAGQLHNIYTMPQTKIATYKRDYPHLLRIEPYAGTYFYRVNVNKPPTDNPLVRKALIMAIDREAIVKNVTRGGQLPGLFFTPPGTAGYTARARISSDLEAARKLLAKAGYPNGEGFPKLEILYNTNEGHRNIAEAIQEMWKKSLNIDVVLVNQEWKVYLAAQRQLDYQVCRAGWIGDYVDPNTFLDMWTSWSQQNQTGWSNAEYDGLIRKASRTQDMNARLEIFQQAEAILLDEAPIIPIYIYTRVYALHPSVKGWRSNILDHHPYKYIRLDPSVFKNL